MLASPERPEMITEAQNIIKNEIKAKGISDALRNLGYWLSGEEICVELDDPKGNRIEQGDYIIEFITPDKPKILLVIKGEQE